MVQVDYKLTLGSTIYTPEDTSRLLQLRMNASLTIPVHSCILVLSASASLSCQPEQDVILELGYKGARSRVFTGKISQVEWGIQQTVITAESCFRQLTCTRLNRLFEKSSAADIVNSVAQTCAGVTVSKAESGIQFPVYTLGNRQTAWEHLQFLAQQCGMDLYADTQDKLVFAKYSPAQTHDCTYGVNVLALEMQQQQPAIAGIEVYGESPASQGQGDQSYPWLAKKEVKGKAGKTSATTLRIVDPTARTEDIADKIAEAYLKAKTSLRQGRIQLLGNGAAKLGDGIKIAKMPVQAQNGNFKITAVTHTLNYHSGFYTTLEWEEV